VREREARLIYFDTAFTTSTLGTNITGS
jgi:hypothetical protein